MSSLLRLPAELMSEVMLRLEIDDIWNLSMTCSQLLQLIYDPHICRRALQFRAPFGKEATDGGRRRDFASTLRTMFKRRLAIRSVRPFTAAVVAQADSFILVDSLLAYTHKRHLRLLDLTSGSGREVVINLPKLLGSTLQWNEFGFVPVHYSHGLLSCVYTDGVEKSSVDTLIVIDIRSWKVVTERVLTSTRKMFVRNNDEFLYYGICDELAAAGEFMWAVFVFDLRTGEWDPRKRTLPHIVGTDVGCDVDFDIFGDYFYGITAESVATERPWRSTTSYYAFRLPVGELTLEAVEHTKWEDMFRREHREGPIDNRWNVIRLEVDERTGAMTVGETRREWVGGCSRKRRAFYRRDVKFPPPRKAGDDSDTDSDDNSRGDDGEGIVTHTPGSVPEPLLPVRPKNRNIHVGEEDDGTAVEYTARRVFLRHYDTRSKTFLDLINDDESDELCYPPAFPRGDTGPCLRLRAISAVGPHGPDSVRVPEWSETQPITDNVTSWSPGGERDLPAEAAALSRILNPPIPEEARCEHVDAVIDDGGTVAFAMGQADYYPYRRSVNRNLVLVSFDPTTHLSGLPKWGGAKPHERRQTPGREAAEAGPDALSADAARDSPRPRSSSKHSERVRICDWAKEEPAKYLSIGWDTGGGIQRPYGFDFSA